MPDGLDTAEYRRVTDGQTKQTGRHLATRSPRCAQHRAV